MNWVKKVNAREMEHLLKDYALAKRMISIAFPNCTPSYSEIKETFSDFKSSTEKYGLKRVEWIQFIEVLDRVLSILTKDEEKLIIESYFSLDPPPAVILCERLSMSRAVYFRKKKVALKKLMNAWNFLIDTVKLHPEEILS